MTPRKPSHGFLLGKFMPPHKGHVFVAETGCNMVDVMTVLVCSTDAEPMDGAGRFATLQECLPRARVKHLHRNLPQAPKMIRRFGRSGRLCARRCTLNQ